MPRIDNKGGAPTWLSRIEGKRAEISGAGGAGAAAAAKAGRAGAAGAERGAPGDGVDPARPAGDAALAAAGLPEKLIADHGPTLRGAADEATALAALAQTLKPHQARQVENALKGFYKTLGAMLTAAPEAERPAVALRSTKALRGLIEAVGPSDHLVPACFAAIGLLDADTRLAAQKRLLLTGKDLAAAAEQATASVLGLRAALAGKDGVSSALNVSTNLIEQCLFAQPAGAAAPLDAQGRDAIRAAVHGFLRDTAPADGFDQALVGRYAAALAAALPKRKGDFAAALKDAAQQALKDIAPARDATLGMLRAPPAGLAAGAPGQAEAARAYAALAAVVEAAPGGPQALLAGVETLAAALLQRAAAGQVDVVAGAARAVELAAGAPIAPALVDELARLAGSFRGTPEEAAAWSRAGQAQDLGSIACELAKASIGAAGHLLAHHPALDGALAQVGGLEPQDAIRVAVAVGPQAPTYQSFAATIEATVAFVDEATRADRPQAALTAFAGRRAVAAQQIASQRQLAGEEPGLSTEIARQTAGALAQPQAQALVQLAHYLRSYGGIPIGPLLAADPSGKPGLLQLADPTQRWANPPLNYIHTFAQLTAGNVDGARVSLELVQALASMGGDASKHLQRMQADFRAAVQNPAALKTAARGQNALNARIAQQAPSVLGHVKAHPELPGELALAAGLHLSAEQMTWLVEKVATNRSHRAARLYRDFVYTLVDSGKLDAFEAMKSSPSPQKAIDAAMQGAVAAWKENKHGQFPWDRVMQGLRDGKDPMAELAAEQGQGVAGAGPGGLDIQALAGGKAAPEGLAQLEKCRAVLDFLLPIYVKGGRTMDADVDMESLRAPMLEVIKQVALGNWPAAKYEGAVAERQLKVFTAAQAEQWKQTLVTPMNGAAADAPPPAETITEALLTLKGLGKAVERAFTLGVPEAPKLKFDAASLAKLAALRDAHVERAKQHGKGTPEHRAASKALAPIIDQIALLELHAALAAHMPTADQQPVKALRAVAPLVDAAAGALGKKGGGFKDAAFEIAAAARSVAGQPQAQRSGVYAADEDTLEALITSNTSGCVGPAYGSAGRQWALAGVAADPNIRMLRVYNGEKQVYRGFLKFFEATLPDGTKGPVLWLDQPMPDGGGGAAEKQLWYKHAVMKAKQMGIPVVAGASYYRAPELEQAAKEAGMQAVSGASVTFHLDVGVTGYMHSDSMFGGKGNLKDLAAKNQLNKAMQVGVLVTP